MNLSEMQAKLIELKDWELKIDCLEKSFFFQTIEQKKKFLNQILDLEEKNKYSPLILIDRRIVKLTLSSGKEGITELDFQIAKEIDKII